MSGMEGMLLFVTSRIAEFVGIVLTIFLFFKGYKAKYVYLVGVVIVISIILSLLSLVFKKYFLPIALGDILLTFLLLAGILLYVVRNPEKTRDFTPPEDARCFYCNALIQREEGLCLMKIGNSTIYFDSLEHFIKFLQEPEYFLKERNLPRGKVREVFIRNQETGEWKSVDKPVLDREGNPLRNSENEEYVRVAELLSSFKKVVEAYSDGGT